MSVNKIIGIIGLGYVGLPLANAFAKVRKNIVCYDTDKTRIEQLNKGFDITNELSNYELDEVKSNIKYTNKIEDLKDCDIYIIAVPTPIDSRNKPDLNSLILASREVAKIINKGNIVIYESTVYPGVTEEVCAPQIEKISGLKFNREFFCGYSPERINPGDKDRKITDIVKVTSGSNNDTAIEIDELYKSIITAGTYKVSSIKVAEACKVIENTQRDLNIALMNELAIIFHSMKINTHEVIDAASTKWNFARYTPGLVGGHCIGVDPYYLTFKAEQLGYRPALILNARQINNGMGRYIAEQTVKTMISYNKKIINSSILILGYSFKENCPDTRNTGVDDIIDQLLSYRCNLDIYDPVVKQNNKFRNRIVHNPFNNEKIYSAIIVTVAHDQFKDLTDKDYKKITDEPPVIIDVKNVVNNATWKL